MNWLKLKIKMTLTKFKAVQMMKMAKMKEEFEVFIILALKNAAYPI